MRKLTMIAGVLIPSALSLLLVLASRPVAPRRDDTSAPVRPPDDPTTSAGLATHEDPLPPAPVAERVVEGAPLSLTASDGSGLAIAELHARAVIEGPLAFTEVRLAFDNPENRVREGTFKIVLPQGASLSRFAMKIGNEWQEGEVVEKEHARRAYEDFLHRKQDPALMEKGAANEFTARVFPIPARGRKEIVVSYAQEVTGGAPFAIPLRGLPQLGVLDVAVTEMGQTQRTREERVTPNADFVMQPAKRATVDAVRAGDLVAMRVRPIAEAMPDPVTSAIVLVDTSASRALGLDAEVARVREVLAALVERHGGGLPVTIAAFDQDVASIYRGDAKGFGDEQANAIKERRALGASNVERALAWAKDEAKSSGAPRVILVSDVVATAGETDAQKLAQKAAALKDAGAQRLDVVAVGGLRDDKAAHALVTAGLAHDGVVVAASDGASAIAQRLEAGTRSNVAVAVEGATWSYPTKLDGVQPGDEAIVYAQMPDAGVVHVKLGDRATSVETAIADRPLVERAWAQAKIASLEDEERTKGKSLETQKAIVDLSTKHRVLSEYTALLVLETEADYARFHIDRRALADVLSFDSNDALAWARRSNAVKGAGRAADFKVATIEDKSAPTTPGAPPADSAADMQSLQGAAIGDAFGAGGLGLSGTGEGSGGLAQHHARRELAKDDEDNSGGTGTRARGEEGSMGNPSAGSANGYGVATPAATATAAASVAMDAPSPEPAAPPPAPRAMARASNGNSVAMLASSAGPGDMGVDPFTGKFKQVKDRLRVRDRRGALALASQWQAAQPGDVLALVALGEAAEANEEPTTAARAYGSIIDLFPSRADLRRFAGERLEHVAGGDALDLAIDTYDKARADRPDHPASHRLAAFARVRKGEYAAAFDIGVAALAQHYPEGRFRGVERILREDLGLIAAAWMKAEPAKRSDILARLRSAGGTIEDGPSLRFVLNWETDANDVDFHIEDAQGGHAYYAQPQLPSGGELYADVTTGYGPECFTIRAARGHRAGPYTLRAHYFSRGPMGYGMGKLEIIEHDGKGGLKFEEREFVVMQDHAFVDLGRI